MPSITVETRHTAAKKAILDGLLRHNFEHAGYTHGRLVTVSFRSADGSILGGATGRSRGPTAFLELFHVEKAYRGNGEGGRLLAAFEEECRRLGARQVYLDTYSFQARPFYEKHGYSVIGQIENYFDGHDSSGCSSDSKADAPFPRRANVKISLPDFATRGSI